MMNALMLASLLFSIFTPSAAFSSPLAHRPSLITPSVRGGSQSSQLSAAKYQIVLLRHGESTWNEENKFTGWADVPLSVKGLGEARESGKLMLAEGFKFDVAYTSVLRRAIHTLYLALEEMDQMYTPVIHTWRLNERHYGALQGLNKQETVDKHGKDQVLVWRRSYDIPPPECETDSVHYPGNIERYHDVDREELPR